MNFTARLILKLQLFHLILAQGSEWSLHSIRGGTGYSPLELNPNYRTTTRLTSSRRNVIFQDTFETMNMQPSLNFDRPYERHSYIGQKPQKSLMQVIIEYANRLHQTSPSLYYGTASSLFFWLLWQVSPFMPLLQRHLVCSEHNVMSGRIHTLLTSAVSHASIGHLIVNTYAFLLFGLSVRRTMIDKVRRGASSQSLWPLCIGAALCGNLCYLACNRILNIPSTGCIGGSSVTFALLAVDAKLHPSKPLGFVIHFFPIRIPAQYALTILTTVSVLGTIGISLGTPGRVSHASHLGGILFGLLYYEVWSRGWTTQLLHRYLFFKSKAGSFGRRRF
jgi:membrane associated rhomboid family serine protease